MTCSRRRSNRKKKRITLHVKNTGICPKINGNGFDGIFESITVKIHGRCNTKSTVNIHFQLSRQEKLDNFQKQKKPEEIIMANLVNPTISISGKPSRKFLTGVVENFLLQSF
uniref:Uncharacterized protein n=1 Tax=Micrurus spixii TaxID=129469 RepID=A0A2D4LUY2_9SAUR